MTLYCGNPKSTNDTFSHHSSELLVVLDVLRRPAAAGADGRVEHLDHLSATGRGGRREGGWWRYTTPLYLKRISLAKPTKNGGERHGGGRSPPERGRPGGRIGGSLIGYVVRGVCKEVAGNISPLGVVKCRGVWDRTTLYQGLRYETCPAQRREI